LLAPGIEAELALGLVVVDPSPPPPPPPERGGFVPPLNNGLVPTLPDWELAALLPPAVEEEDDEAPVLEPLLAASAAAAAAAVVPILEPVPFDAAAVRDELLCAASMSRDPLDPLGVGVFTDSPGVGSEEVSITAAAAAEAAEAAFLSLPPPPPPADLGLFWPFASPVEGGDPEVAAEAEAEEAGLAFESF
jgi:hypothetical protein